MMKMQREEGGALTGQQRIERMDQPSTPEMGRNEVNQQESCLKNLPSFLKTYY